MVGCCSLCDTRWLLFVVWCLLLVGIGWLLYVVCWLVRVAVSVCSVPFFLIMLAVGWYSVLLVVVCCVLPVIV